MKRGRIIAFEGVDGAGKSTVIKVVADHLSARGSTVFLPRTGKEHSSRPTRMIRRLTRDRCNLALEAMPEFLLYAAREAQVLAEQVRPALARGETVLLDRSMWTPIVLGSYGRGLDLELTSRIADSVTEGLRPDETLIFDVDPRTSRIRKRMDKVRNRQLRDAGRKGLSGSALKIRVREGYADLARREGFPVFHAERSSPHQVAARVITYLEGGRVTEDPIDAQPSWQVDPALSFEDALDELPDLVALYFSRRIPLGRALRARLLDRYPRLVAWATDLEDPLWTRIDELAPEERAVRMPQLPYREGGWRDRLVDTCPDDVARSLIHHGPEADGLRTRLAEVVPGAVVESLAGRADAFAAQLRDRCWKHADSYERAISLMGLSDESSRVRRGKLLDKDPAIALHFMRGIPPEQCNAPLEYWAHKAPKSVLKGLTGRSDDFAHDLRRRLLDCGREVVDSVRGLDDPRSWELRDDCATRWPSTVAWSCAGLGRAQDARVSALLDVCQSTAPDDLFLKRRSYQLQELGRLDDAGRRKISEDFDA